MKKLLLSLLLLTSISQAQIVNIPDANFKAKLLSSSPSNSIARNTSNMSFAIDANSDGEIQLAEAQEVGVLNVQNAAISSMEGIQAFTNMTRLSLTGSAIINLDVSNLANLESLSCYNNPAMVSLNVSGCMALNVCDVHECALINLDVSGLANLEDLSVNDNQLATLNVSGCVNLQDLGCNNNNLQLLDVSGLANLYNLNVSYNALTDLNLTGCVNLRFLNCMHNQINALNVYDMETLDLVGSFNNLTTLVLNTQGTYTSFQLDHNQLTSIDLSNLDLSGTGLLGVHLEYNNLTSISLNKTKLYSIRLENNNLATINLNEVVGINTINLSDNPNLTSIFAKNGANEEFLGLSNDLNLVFICADEFQIQDVNAALNMYQIPNAVVSPYCIFQPGGNFNTITGNITFDADNNGCDSTDPDQPYVKLTLTGGNNNYAVFTSPGGTYSNFGQTGTFNVSVAAENLSLFTITPPLATIVFGNNNNNLTTQDFCITANGVQNDLETVIVPIGPARPGFDAHYKIIYKNKGNQVLNGNIDFNYPENVSDFADASVAPAVQGSGILSWNFFNLYPFESRSIEVTLNVNGPMETPAVNIGDQLNFSVQANPIAGDVTINDNAFSLKQIVTGSFDPNDITCLEGEHVNPTEIGKYLHYNINFENTGTAAAENIVVKDMIDLTKYDISSLQILNASHPVTTRITNDKVEFIFENINLGASEHGNVTFKIKTKNTLVTGNSVSNKADIYFDYNFPVATNTAMTTFDTLGIDNQNLDNGISIYPNPTNGVVNIKADSEVLSVELFDVRGRKLMMKNNVNILNISGYNPGIYFVKVNTDQGSRTQKLIKQ